MPIIELQRTSEYINRIRSFKIYIDGQQVGTIDNGETKEFDITSGQHSLYAKIDWCSSPTLSFTVKDGETKKIIVGSFKHGKSIILIGLILVALNLIFTYTLDFYYITFLSIPILLILAYYTTIGRKKYLSLYEIES